MEVWGINLNHKGYLEHGTIVKVFETRNLAEKWCRDHKDLTMGDIWEVT